jgi:hypothetical protein
MSNSDRPKRHSIKLTVGRIRLRVRSSSMLLSLLALALVAIFASRFWTSLRGGDLRAGATAAMQRHALSSSPSAPPAPQVVTVKQHVSGNGNVTIGVDNARTGQ